MRHVFGDRHGGSFEWATHANPVASGTAVFALDSNDKITSVSFHWDRSFLDDKQVTALTVLAVDPRR